MKKLISALLTLCMLVLAVPSMAEPSTFAGGSGTPEDPWQIETAGQLDAVRNDLTASYVLTADIDLAGIDFAPIGAFVPASGDIESDEVPDAALAFSGTFDGQGHVISNLTIVDEENYCIGLFSCVYGEDARVANLTLKNLTLTGMAMVGAIGYGAMGQPIEDIHVEGGTLTGFSMVGAVLGGGMMDMKNCSAQADIIVVGDDAQYNGIVVGGLEEASIEGCRASGTVTATGARCFSLGGVAGCIEGGAYAKDCTAEDVVIVTGDHSFLIGGVAGHAGMSSAVTRIEGCKALNYDIQVGEGAQRIGGIVGGGFYISAYAESFPAPERFAVVNCEASGTISGGEMTGSIAGYVHDNSTVEDCTGDDPQIGADASTVSLDQLY